MLLLERFRKAILDGIILKRQGLTGGNSQKIKKNAIMALVLLATGCFSIGRAEYIHNVEDKPAYFPQGWKLNPNVPANIERKYRVLSGEDAYKGDEYAFVRG
jgi:hypothetical protein